MFTLRTANHTIYESTNNDWGKNCFAFFVLFCLSGCGVRQRDGIWIRQRMERERNRIHHRYTLMRLRWIQLWFEETVFYWIRNYYRVWQLLVNILFGSWISAHEYRKWLSSSRRDVTQTGGGFPMEGFSASDLYHPTIRHRQIAPPHSLHFSSEPSPTCTIPHSKRVIMFWQICGLGSTFNGVINKNPLITTLPHKEPKGRKT